MMIRLFLVALLIVVCLAPAFAQPEHDQAFRRILDQTGFQHTIDSDGDFKMTLSRQNGRTQAVWAYSNTTSFENMDMRQISTVAYTYSAPMPSELAERILKLNADYKIGAFKVVGPRKSDGKMLVMFYVKIPIMPNPETLKAVLTAVAITADDLEKELLGTDEL